MKHFADWCQSNFGINVIEKKAELKRNTFEELETDLVAFLC